MPAEATRASDAAADSALPPEWLVLGSLTVPGRPEHVRTARQFVARTLGGDPQFDAVLLLTSEVVTNAVRHSRSALPGGTVSVVVARNPTGLLVLVTDNGSEAGVPVVSDIAGAENGNGLLLVEKLSDVWGYTRDEARTTVWFRLHATDHALAVHHRPGLSSPGENGRDPPAGPVNWPAGRLLFRVVSGPDHQAEANA